jgi:hypothetical protein
VSKKQLPPSKITKAEEDWITKKWRPMMAIMYMIACIFDFVLFPIMFTGVQFWEVQAANDAFRQWAPITLQGGGLFHVAMGAVLGVSAWSRGQEKMAGAAGGPVGSGQPMAQSTSFTPQMQNTAPHTWGSAPAQTGWSTTPVAANTWGSAPATTGWGGKKAPPEAEFPVL